MASRLEQLEAEVVVLRQLISLEVEDRKKEVVRVEGLIQVVEGSVKKLDKKVDKEVTRVDGLIKSVETSVKVLDQKVDNEAVIMRQLISLETENRKKEVVRVDGLIQNVSSSVKVLDKKVDIEVKNLSQCIFEEGKKREILIQSLERRLQQEEESRIAADASMATNLATFKQRVIGLEEYNERRTQLIVQQIGQCDSGKNWVKQPDGRYVCEGGSHALTEAEVLCGRKLST